MSTKLGKVLNHISHLPDERVPQDEVFKFRERTLVLINLWRQILGRAGVDEFCNMPVEGTTSSDSTGETVQHHGESSTADVKTGMLHSEPLDSPFATPRSCNLITGTMESPVESSTVQDITRSAIVPLESQELGPSSGEEIIGPGFVERTGALDVNTDAVSTDMPRRENPADDWRFIEEEAPLEISSHQTDDST